MLAFSLSHHQLLYLHAYTRTQELSFGQLQAGLFFYIAVLCLMQQGPGRPPALISASGMSHSVIFVQTKRPTLKCLSPGPQSFSAAAMARGGSLRVTEGGESTGKLIGEKKEDFLSLGDQLRHAVPESQKGSPCLGDA